MPQMSVTELNKKLKGKNYSSLYYFYGKDVMSVELYTKTLVKKLVSDDEAVYNFHKFNGKDKLSDFVFEYWHRLYRCLRNIYALP